MIYVELAVVLVLVIFNGLLALAELAVVSSRPDSCGSRFRRSVGPTWHCSPVVSTIRHPA